MSQSTTRRAPGTRYRANLRTRQVFGRPFLRISNFRPEEKSAIVNKLISVCLAVVFLLLDRLRFRVTLLSSQDDTMGFNHTCFLRLRHLTPPSYEVGHAALGVLDL